MPMVVSGEEKKPKRNFENGARTILQKHFKSAESKMKPC